MTKNRTYLVEKLLDGHYLLPYKRGNTKLYRLFDAKANPVRNFTYKSIKNIDKFFGADINIWKKDNIGRMTLNLSNVRRLHGGNMIKILYKQKHNNEKVHH